MGMKKITPFGFKIIYGLVSIILTALVAIMFLAAVWHWY